MELVLDPITSVAKCWGYNINGELGNGANANTGTPTPILMGGQSAIPVGTKLIAISTGTSAMGGGTSCVISESNKLYCWGDNRWGTLGNGTTESSNVAKAVFTSADSPSSQLPANAKIVYVSSNNQVTCALDWMTLVMHTVGGAIIMEHWAMGAL